MFSHLQRQWSPKITAILSEMGPFKEREEISAPPSRVGRKPRKEKGPEAAARVLVVTPVTKHRLRLLKLERIKDYLLMEEEFVGNQGFLKTWIFGLCCRN